MKSRLALVALAALVVAVPACSESASPAGPGVDPADTIADTLLTPFAGGDMTVFDTTGFAYSLVAPNIDAAHRTGHERGRVGFNTGFAPAPAEVKGGLGPLFNGLSCIRCHESGSRTAGTQLLRFSGIGTDEHGGPTPIPGFGTQLQDRAITGFEREGRLDLIWTEITGAFSDGTPYSLRTPAPDVSRTYIPFAAPLTTIRTARPVFGLGLLEAVPDEVLEALTDPGDANGDGISGRVNRVWDIVAQTEAIGRFGWKASQPTLLQQIDAAYLEDMGVTTSLFPEEATAGQAGGEDGFADDPELADEEAEEVLLYVRTLGVPGRRNVNDADVRQGQDLFSSIGCASCHIPTLQTGALEGVAEASGQTIHAYTDLLLHDMGDGLADGRPDFQATGVEWRTAPLWGIGLANLVVPGTEFLHDGRARSVEEAVLWHGGEAQAARDAFATLAASARAALLSFLGSL